MPVRFSGSMLTPTQILILLLSALVAGVAKTGLPAITALVVPVMALGFGAKDSVPIILLFYLMGDLFALRHYGKDCEWPLLKGLIPGVIPGLVLGAATIAWVSERTAALLIGAIVLCIAMSLLFRRRPPAEPAESADSGGIVATRVLTGTVAGFATSAANSAGPIMALYLLSSGLRKRSFLGTTAWFFFLVNLTKVGLYVAFGIFTIHSLKAAMAGVLAVPVGAWIGKRFADRMGDATFARLILVFVMLSAFMMIAKSV